MTSNNNGIRCETLPNSIESDRSNLFLFGIRQVSVDQRNQTSGLCQTLDVFTWQVHVAGRGGPGLETWVPGGAALVPHGENLGRTITRTGQAVSCCQNKSG